MIAWIKQWSQGIIIAVIVATIIEMLLPNNKNKKYINTVIGIYILFTIISPIISKITGKSISIEDYIYDDTKYATSYTMNNIVMLENSSNVEDIYVKTLKSDIINKLKLKGYMVKSINLKININSTTKNYGEIEGMYLNVCTLENVKINEVKEVKINSSNDNESNKNSISEGELNNIKEFLMETYGIEKSKININKEE